MLAPVGPWTWQRLISPLPLHCLLSARWLVGLTLPTSISVLQSDAPAAVIWPAGWSSRTVSRSSVPRGLRLVMPPNEAPFPGSQLQLLPIWHGSPIQMHDSQVWGGEKEKKHATKFLNSGTVCPLCIKPILKLNLWLSYLLGSGDISNFAIWNLPCWPW